MEPDTLSLTFDMVGRAIPVGDEQHMVLVCPQCGGLGTRKLPKRGPVGVWPGGVHDEVCRKVSELLTVLQGVTTDRYLELIVIKDADGRLTAPSAELLAQWRSMFFRFANLANRAGRPVRAAWGAEPKTRSGWRGLQRPDPDELAREQDARRAEIKEARAGVSLPLR